MILMLVIDVIEDLFFQLFVLLKERSWLSCEDLLNKGEEIAELLYFKGVVRRIHLQ